MYYRVEMLTEKAQIGAQYHKDITKWEVTTKLVHEVV
jgi:hypothetical protein